MCYIEIDPQAKKLAECSGLQPCLFTPIAAVNEEAILKYIGRISNIVSYRTQNKALLVEIDNLPTINKRLPIWELEESRLIHHQKQLWVHVNYTSYRKAYIRSFYDEDLSNFQIDHIMNRKVARLKGFNYLRVIPISVSANTSSGGHVEKMSIKFLKEAIKLQSYITSYMPPYMSVQYADLADIVKMLSIQTGPDVLDPVNIAQKLVDEPI